MCAFNSSWHWIMLLLRRNSICTRQMLMHTQHLAAVAACAWHQGCVFTRKIAPLSMTACPLPRGPIRLAGPSTQNDMKQMRNKAQTIMSAGNICEGVELWVINNPEWGGNPSQVLQPSSHHVGKGLQGRGPRQETRGPRGRPEGVRWTAARRHVVFNTNASWGRNNLCKAEWRLHS